jgi:hypothetical protein
LIDFREPRSLLAVNFVFCAGDVDFRFTLDTGRFPASQRTVEMGH